MKNAESGHRGKFTILHIVRNPNSEVKKSWMMALDIG